VLEEVGTSQCHSIAVNCECGGVATRIIRNVMAIVPDGFKSIRPYRPEVANVKADTEHICKQRNWNPKKFLDDSFYNGSRE